MNTAATRCTGMRDHRLLRSIPGLESTHQLLRVTDSTVHAFSVFALVERSSGYRLYWGIYVLPVGRITSWYMRLIDPFRRVVIYPAVLRHIRAAWSRREATA